MKLAAVAVFVLALQCAVVTAHAGEQAKSSAAELVSEFNNEKVFWLQAEIGERIIALDDRRVLPQLEGWLSSEDRHVRGNAAFIFAALGDSRGIQVISAMLTDVADRPEGQGIAATIGGDGRFVLAEQIKTDRYYAAHLLGELKDPRALRMLIPLLADESINYKVAWALGEIGGASAVDALIIALNDKSPDVRVIAVHSLGKLGAVRALPLLHALLADAERCHFDVQQSVGEAARDAIRKLEPR
jgi:HEAT repeat protein